MNAGASDRGAALRCCVGAAMLVLLLAGCEQRPVGAVAADASRSEREAARVGRGAALIEAVGCGSCHRVPGIRGAVGDVGPPLMYVARRTFIAGQVPNTTENLVRWLKDPPALVPGTAMPALGLSDSQARDIAAYLQTLR